jgi:DNA-binding response OmpR family regulator
MTGVMHNRAFRARNFCECCGQLLEKTVQKGGVSIKGRRITFKDQEALLTVQQSAFLQALLQNYPAPKPRENIFNAVWGHDSPVGDKILDVTAYKIRKVIRPIGLDIKSEWGIGYRLEICK